MVTGGGSGIGQAIAGGLQDAGAAVVVADIDEETARVVAERIRGHARQCDVSDPDRVRALAENCASEFGPVGILVNKTPADWDRLLGVSVVLPGPVRTRISAGQRNGPSVESTGPEEIELAVGAPRHLRFLEPSEVGKRVVRAIENSDRCVITHPELWGSGWNGSGRLSAWDARAIQHIIRTICAGTPMTPADIRPFGVLTAALSSLGTAEQCRTGIARRLLPCHTGPPAYGLGRRGDCAARDAAARTLRNPAIV